jgi:hypothetical protein
MTAEEEEGLWKKNVPVADLLKMRQAVRGWQN